jgi:hypothetical protein
MTSLTLSGAIDSLPEAQIAEDVSLMKRLLGMAGHSGVFVYQPYPQG